MSGAYLRQQAYHSLRQRPFGAELHLEDFVATARSAPSDSTETTAIFGVGSDSIANEH
jgi:hypothetical protein